MNRKINRNEKHKYSNEEKLALGENENTSALINIAQEDDSNIFELLQNLLCLLFTFVFILILLYTQMFLMLQFS